MLDKKASESIEPATELVQAVDGGVASEIAYYNESGELIGYWAYGSWDPSYPYQGQSPVREKPTAEGSSS